MSLFAMIHRWHDPTEIATPLTPGARSESMEVCDRFGRAPSRSAWSTCRSRSTAPPRTTTCPLHQVHDKDGGRIKYQRRCEICGRIVDYEHIDKAFDDGDRTVILTDEGPLDAARGAQPRDRGRRVRARPTSSTRSCSTAATFSSPTRSRRRRTRCCAAHCEETDRTAIVHFALRQKTRLGALRVRGDVLVLQSLLWDDEVREAKFPSLEREAAGSPRPS